MKFKVVKPDCETKITIKSGVYYRTNRLLMKYMSLLDKDGMETVRNDIAKAEKDQSYLDTLDESSPTYHYLTLYYLLLRMENAFKDDGNVEMVEKSIDELNDEIKAYNMEVISESHESQQA